MSKENPNELKIINKNERLKYQKLLYTYKQQISDLQSQLAEKNQAIEGLQEINQSLGQTCNNDAKEIERLNKLLAEKEEEIEELKKEIRDELVDNNMAILELQQSQNQTAIDELEKVKDIILNERKITNFKFDIFNKGKDTALFWLNEQIDNQINELKGKVGDVKD